MLVYTTTTSAAVPAPLAHHHRKVPKQCNNALFTYFHTHPRENRTKRRNQLTNPRNYTCDAIFRSSMYYCASINELAKERDIDKPAPLHKPSNRCASQQQGWRRVKGKMEVKFPCVQNNSNEARSHAQRKHICYETTHNTHAAVSSLVVHASADCPACRTKRRPHTYVLLRTSQATHAPDSHTRSNTPHSRDRPRSEHGTPQKQTALQTSKPLQLLQLQPRHTPSVYHPK